MQATLHLLTSNPDDNLTNRNNYCYFINQETGKHEVNLVIKIHIACKWRSQNLNPGFPVSR